jgi:hypothetical protein
METRDAGSAKDTAGRFVPVQRLPYRSPALVEFGNVSKLTENGAGSGGDGGAAGMSMNCL